MSSVEYSLTIFKICGVWRPENWSSGWKYYLYNTYRIFTILPLLSLAVLEMITLSMSFENIEKLATNCTMTFSIFNVSGKVITLLVHREHICRLLHLLTRTSLCGQDAGEKEAIDNIDRKIRFRSKLFICIKMTALVAMLYMTLIISVPQRIVWIDVWMPIHFSANTQFIVLMIYEIAGHYTAALVAMGYDTFVPGMMLQVSAQLKLLQHRIRMTLETMESQWLKSAQFKDYNREHTEKIMIAGWIRHHLLIYQFAAELRRIFSPMIFVQYSSSMILLCVNIYAIAQVPLFSPPFIRALVYNTILFMQIFLLCLVGTEVMDHSSFFGRSIYVTQWYLLSHESKKSVNLMMTRSLKSIKFTSAGIIETSLESFVRLVKVSYSAYTCLQRVSQDE